MKTTLFACALVLLSVTCAAKPQIDASVYDGWPSVDGAQISEDGSYASYVERAGSSPAKLVIVSTDARWRMELPAASAADFVCELRSACRFMVVRELQGALSVVQLGGSSVARLGAVETYKVSARGRSPWLAYQPRSESQQLRLVNLNTQQERRFEKVVEYAFGTDGRSLLITTAAESQALQWLDLDTGKATTIWQGRGVSGAVFDDSGKRLAFVADSADADPTGRSFWYYAAGTARAQLVADNRSPTLSAGLRLNGIREFSKDGRHLLIDLQRNVPTLEPAADAVDVDVWSYRDERLQSQQLADLAAGRTDRNYAALLNLESRHIVQLEHNNELIRERAFNTRLGEVALLDRRSGSAARSEHHWSSAGKLSTELLLFRNGRRIPVSTWDAADESRPQLSPGGRFVVYFDPAKQVFLSLDTASGIVREISRGIDTNWQRVDAQWLPLSWSRLRGVAGWLQGDAAVLIYDRYDVWQIDLSGKAAPINVTNGYGNRTQTIFSVRSDVMPHERVFARNERLILPAFERATKHSGFFTQRLGQAADPQRLSMGPYAYYLPTHERGMPIKAERAQRYVLQRESATESPNYFSTADFVTFTRLSELKPEQTYNWLNSQLLTWPRSDGQVAQGILYTPEDFDPARKYPVIFNYYDLVADDLHVYTPPRLLDMDCEINVPSYVSRGYVVFKPDIYYAPGELRRSAVTAVLSAAEHLKQQPWVDAKKMAIAGCSFGGIATNSIVTSTGLFAAAASASGIADLVSAYGSLWVPNARAGASGGASLQSQSERGQERMAGTLWDRPGAYVENSAIFHVDQVTTPILMMHTRDDAICPFPNAIEFFTALRRLGKTAWMLQYNNGNHTLAGKSAADFSVRMAQFFDHYLRDAPPPKWMTQGIPAHLKGVETGLELDIGANTPGPGLATPLPTQEIHR